MRKLLLGRVSYLAETGLWVIRRWELSSCKHWFSAVPMRQLIYFQSSPDSGLLRGVPAWPAIVDVMGRRQEIMKSWGPRGRKERQSAWDPQISPPRKTLPVGTFILFFFPFIFISCRLITLQYCSGFCHTLTWISHGFTCIPHPDPPSHLPPHPIPLGLPSAPAISRQTFIFNFLKWGATKMSFNRWWINMHECMVHPYNRMPFNNKKDWALMLYKYMDKP